MPADAADPPARYIFRVTVRFDLEQGYRSEPDSFETVLSRTAEPPGQEGWLFFRDTLWRGSWATTPTAVDWPRTLGVPVESVSFSELRTNERYLDE